jgi:Cd2+/Zn2+-exporting ATPase
MVSGDRGAVAERVGRAVGCDEAAGDCLPGQKLEWVRRLRSQGYRVAVVGDGVNDAPALAAGDLGIAMGAAGSEVAIHSATIALMNNDLRRIPFLLRLARATGRVINQNFLLGLVFVLGGMALGALRLITPVVAALLHVTGSLLVVFNSFRLVRQGEELEPLASGPVSVPPAPAGPRDSESHREASGAPQDQGASP